ncbi:hypothetical protein ABK040_015502 [Willaertia magna]
MSQELVIESILNPNDKNNEEELKELQHKAKEIVLAGLKERFGELNPNYNQDLNQLSSHYYEFLGAFLISVTKTIENNNVTITKDKQLIGTGALSIDDKFICGKRNFRIERVSILKEFRRNGYAYEITRRLIEIAKEKKQEENVGDVVLVETDVPWVDAIGLYKKLGFKEVKIEDGCVHMELPIVQ